MECLICIETFDETDIIICPCRKIFCCQKCTTKYILQSGKKAHCMECKLEWSEKFLHDNFSKRWLTSNKNGGYRHHLKMIILEEEKVKLRHTISRIDETKRRVFYEDLISNLRKRKREESGKAMKMKKEFRRKRNLREDVSRHQSAIDECERKSRDIDQLIQNYTHEMQNTRIMNETSFTFNCPMKRCMGLVEAGTMKCKICKAKVCKKCREKEEEEDHECDKDIVENIKTIEKETKNCPKCNSLIYRISGCNDMWCTICRIYFDWRTGNRITRKGYIDNPHAVEWLERRMYLTRNFDDIPCGGIEYINYNKIQDEEIISSISRIYRLVESINEYLLKNINIEDTEELREKYVLGTIMEEQWMNKVYRFHRREERKRKNVSILETLRILIVERTRNLKLELEEIEYDKDCKYSLKFISNIDEIVKFINETFRSELELLGSKSPLKIINYVISK